MEEMISEKKDRDEGSSSSSNSVRVCQRVRQLYIYRQQPTFRMLVAKRTLPHVGQLDCAFRTCVHEPVATLRVELRGSNDLGQFLHVRGFDVNNVEALILDI